MLYFLLTYEKTIAPFPDQDPFGGLPHHLCACAWRGEAGGGISVPLSQCWRQTVISGGNRRGVYGGIVGYIDFTGNLDTCIAIRTALLHDGIAYVQAGAGIVADSDPEAENQECRNKAAAVLTAIHAANRLPGK